MSRLPKVASILTSQLTWITGKLLTMVTSAPKKTRWRRPKCKLEASKRQNTNQRGRHDWHVQNVYRTQTKLTDTSNFQLILKTFEWTVSVISIFPKMWSSAKRKWQILCNKLLKSASAKSILYLIIIIYLCLSYSLHLLFHASEMCLKLQLWFGKQAAGMERD